MTRRTLKEAMERPVDIKDLKLWRDLWDELKAQYGNYELVAPEQPKPEPEACDPTGLYYTRGEVHAAIDSRVSDALKQEREKLAKAVRRSYAKDLMMFVKKLADELERGEG